MSGSQVASEKPDVTVDNPFQDKTAVSCVKLATDFQLCSPAYGGHRTSSLAARCVLLHCCFQNQEIRNIASVSITTSKHFFKASGLRQLLQKILINRDSEGGFESDIPGDNPVYLHAPLRGRGFTVGRGLCYCSLSCQLRRRGSKNDQDREYD